MFGLTTKKRLYAAMCQQMAAELKEAVITVTIDVVKQQRDEAIERAEQAEAEVERLRAKLAGMVPAADLEKLKWRVEELSRGLQEAQRLVALDQGQAAESGGR